MQLKNKKALVTGAGRGIGRAIALALAEAGCDVAVAARTAAEVDDTAVGARALGRTAFAYTCDVGDTKAVDTMVKAALRDLGQVDILVNNAGYTVFKPFHEITLEDWRRTLDVNLTSMFVAIQAVLPGMKARRSGRIINVSSVTGIKPIENQGAYCAAKHGVNGLTKSLALELRDYGIGVHAICPGGVRTRLTEESMPDRDKSNWMTPEDIAHTALYLATLSPRAAVDILTVRRFGSVPLNV